jgi:hypothetical protein
MARRLSSFARPRSLVALVAATLVAALLATIPGAPPVAAADTQTSGVPAAAPPVAKVSAPPMSSPCDKKQAAASVTSKGRDLAATMPVVARTDKTTTYQGPCGTQTIEIHQNATNWKDAAGTWYPIDRTLARTPAGHWKNTSGPFTVDLADRADAAAVATVGQGAWNIGFSLQGAKGASTTASGDAATYRNVMSGIDLDEAVTGSGLKESVVVNTLPAGSGDLTFDFPLTLIGVTPSTAADGLIVFSTAGVTVATLAPAVAWDANKAPVPGAVIPVTQTLVPSTGGWAIHLSVPAAWARDPARALPITVDPSINLQNTGTSPGCTGGQDQDAFASSPDANGVYCDWTADGGQHEDWVGYDNWSPVSQQWTYQNFDMSQLYGKDIISATWYDQVIAHKVGDPNWTDYFKIAAVSNWVNNSPTWNLGDVHWSTAGDQGVIGHHADTWHDVRVAPGNQAAVNVQAEVAFWANRSWSPALGFELDTAGHNDAVHLASNQAPGLIGPAIYVTYNTIPNVPDQLSPASGWTGPTGSPRLFAHYSDPDGDSGNVDFEVYGPNSYYVFQPVGTSNGGTPYLDLNATTPGTYSWHVRAWDGRDTSNWSAGWQTFTIGDNPPNIPDQLTPSDGNLSVTQPALSAR